VVKTLTQTVQNLLGQKLKAISPDFVAETKDAIYLIETKKEGDIKTNEVQEKAVAALEFCKHATEFNLSNGKKKPWKYVLIPHNAVLANMSFEHLTKAYEIRDSH